MSIASLMRRMRGGRPLGLLHEAPRSTDRVWLPDEEGKHTDIAKLASAARPGSVPSLEVHAPPIDDQDGNSCVGEMAMGLIAIKESVVGLPYDPPSALAAYLQSVMTHTTPGTEPIDGGTYIRACLSEIRRKGVATLADWPRGRRNLMRPVPATVRAPGYNRRGLEYRFIQPRSIVEEMEATDAAIAARDPVGFGWSVTERYALHQGATPFDARLRKSDRVLGGHAEVQVSARDEAGNVRIRGSWGTRRGDGGHTVVIAETMTRRDIVVVSGWSRLVEVKHA